MALHIIKKFGHKDSELTLYNSHDRWNQEQVTIVLRTRVGEDFDVLWMKTVFSGLYTVQNIGAGSYFSFCY